MKKSYLMERKSHPHFLFCYAHPVMLTPDRKGLFCVGEEMDITADGEWDSRYVYNCVNTV